MVGVDGHPDLVLGPALLAVHQRGGQPDAELMVDRLRAAVAAALARRPAADARDRALDPGSAAHPPHPLAVVARLEPHAPGPGRQPAEERPEGAAVQVARVPLVDAVLGRVAPVAGPELDAAFQ